MEKLYIVVRSDIAPGLQIAQSCHALRSFVEQNPSEDKQWFEGSNNLVCLQVSNEDSLVDLVRSAVCAEMPYAEFREPDLDGSLTAIALGGDAKRLISSLPLALRKAA